MEMGGKGGRRLTSLHDGLFASPLNKPRILQLAAVASYIHLANCYNAILWAQVLVLALLPMAPHLLAHCLPLTHAPKQQRRCLQASRSPADPLSLSRSPSRALPLSLSSFRRRRVGSCHAGAAAGQGCRPG